ncbi:hypothetical protein H8B09_06820 [Paenibacillus sp. PR3]|uniref:DUF4825 domain-containing protein n=1 Tax=Paenibacillus terricola TaxID=2763503 RepID=A0ABR8MR42_9BACL|nr:hypothetical protein [Paenibacillus terricola]MBD3918461.1 hypothetical protein [Paenibacillus terricola]
MTSIRIGKTMILLLLIVLATACQKSDSTTFDALMDGSVINKVEFRDGGSGYLYRTEDKEKIDGLQSLLNSKSYKQVKTPESYTGYLYSGMINDELGIGFAMGDLIVKDVYYHIVGGDDQFYGELIKVVEAFGKVAATDGNTP